MKKIQVKPASITASSESYKANSLVEYPIDVKGDDQKMIEYGNEMISMWTLELQSLQEKKKHLKENPSGDLEINDNLPEILMDDKKIEHSNDRKSGRRQTVVIADQLKETLKKKIMYQPKANNDETKEDNQIGLIRPVLNSKRFNINKTIATKLFGDNYITKPNIYLFLSLGTLFTVSSTLSSMAVWKFISPSLVYSAVFCWPLILYFYIVLMNIDIAKLVLHQQQTMVYILWCFIFYIAMLFEYRTQDNYAGRVIGWTVLLFSTLCVPLFDSITNIDIRMIWNKIGMPGCFFLLCFQQVAMFLNWPSIPESNNIQLFGHINMSVAALASSSLNNIIILIDINIFSAYMHPQSLIMVKSRVDAVLMSEEEAVALRAMDQIGNETAEANKQQDIIQVMTGKIINKFSSSSGGKKSQT